MPVTTQKKPELPRVATTATPIPEKPVIQSSPVPTPATMTITVPVRNWDVGYSRKNLDVVLTRDQAMRLKGILLGLEETEAKLKNGKYVSTPVDAIRWMLENAK